MQNDHPSQSGSQKAPGETPADKEWSEFERDLDTLGRQLAALQVHTASLGSHLVASLEARFQEVKNRATSFKQATEQQLDQARQTAWQQTSEAEGAFSEARARSTEAAREAARQVWERSEPLRQGARDVGDGLVRAWSELRASFGKAAGRLHTEEPGATSPVPAATDERREST
jgi:hypothetical protein